MNDEKNLRYKFKAEKKLKKRREFLQCYSQGKRYFSTNFIIFVLPRKRDDLGICLGVGVSKKTGNAVKRNRVKRVVREFFRLYQHELKVDCNLVVVPKKKLDVNKLSFAQVESEFIPLFKRIKKDIG